MRSSIFRSSKHVRDEIYSPQSTHPYPRTHTHTHTHTHTPLHPIIQDPNRVNKVATSEYVKLFRNKFLTNFSF